MDPQETYVATDSREIIVVSLGSAGLMSLHRWKGGYLSEWDDPLLLMARTLLLGLASQFYRKWGGIPHWQIRIIRT